MSTLRLLGSRVDRLTFAEALQSIEALATRQSFHQVITTNTLMLLAAEHDPSLQSILEHASLSVPESAGILWASRALGQPLREKIPGIDLLVALCERASQTRKSVYFLGAKPGVAEAAAQALQKRFPELRVAGTHHGYFSRGEEKRLFEEIRAAAPDFLFVGMSVPAQEKWIDAHASDLGLCVAMGVGGSFDVLSGQLHRAPFWMQRSGIEWLYRVLQEPWRWRRIAQLPLFVWKVLYNQRAKTNL